MMRHAALFLLLVLVGILAPALHAQQLPSCDEQLAEALVTLSFVRASRQGIEEAAGRVAATLQKRLDVSVQEVEKLRHPETTTQAPSSPSPLAQKGSMP